MAANLARAGFPVTVWNRTPAAPGAGGGRCRDGGNAGRGRPRDRRRCHRRLCVSDTPDVEAVLFGPDGRRRRAPRPAASSSTARRSRRPATRDFAARLRERGVGYVDAPVSGGSEGAQKRDADDLRRRRRGRRRARPAGPRGDGQDDHPRRPVGAGQAVKAVNQVIIAGTYLGVAEGMVLAHQGRASTPTRSSRRSAAARPRAGSSQPQRPDDRQRLPARVQGRAPPQGPGDRARPRPRDRAPRCRSPRWPPSSRSGLVARRPRRRGHVGPRPRDPVAARASDG